MASTDEHAETLKMAIRHFICVEYGWPSVRAAGAAMGFNDDDWSQYSSGRRTLTPYHMARMVAVVADPALNPGDEPTESRAVRDHAALVSLISSVALVEYQRARTQRRRRAMWASMPAPNQ